MAEKLRRQNYATAMNGGGWGGAAVLIFCLETVQKFSSISDLDTGQLLRIEEKALDTFTMI